MRGSDISCPLMHAGTLAEPLDAEEAEWQQVMATNLRGMFFMVKAVGLLMKGTGNGGSIINISSISGTKRGMLPGGVVYSTSKAAVHQMTEVNPLAREQVPVPTQIHVILKGLTLGCASS